MSILKRLRWGSLILLLLSYSTLGWVISEIKPPLLVWLVLVFVVLLFVSSLTIPWSRISDFSTFVFKSNSRTFLLSVSLAFFFFLMIAWFRVFLDTLLIISAAILAKIDFQVDGFSPSQAFLITSIVALIGIALGAGLQIFVVRYVF